LPAGDAARLVAARLGLALSEAFDRLREGWPVDIDEILRRARAGQIRELTVKGLTLPNGTTIAEAEINTPEDEAMMRRMLGHLAQVDPLTAAARGYVEPQPHPAPAKGPTLAKAIQAHLADLARARLAAKTVLDSTHTLRIFQEVVGGATPVSALESAHVRAFYEVVSFWPSNASKREPYKGRPVREVVELAKAKDEPLPSAHTLKKHQQRLSVFFVAQLAGNLLKTNPQAGVRGFELPNEDDTGEPFTDAELGVVFGPAFKPWAAKYPHRWFGVLLGLYSGARVAEVGQLQVDDVAIEDGVHGFFIRTKAKSQKVKNQSSRRFVPLAEPVLAAGFLDYVEEVRAAGHSRLFPNLPNATGKGFGVALSKQFSKFIKDQGITAKGQGFHGFRHTMASKLDRAGVSEAAIGALLGHKRAGSVLKRHYVDRGTLPDRVATLAKFAPPVQFPSYVPGQFAEALAEAPIRLRVVKPTKVANV
jgi:hypothetical protein